MNNSKEGHNPYFNRLTFAIIKYMPQIQVIVLIVVSQSLF